MFHKLSVVLTYLFCAVFIAACSSGSSDGESSPVASNPPVLTTVTFKEDASVQARGIAQLPDGKTLVSGIANNECFIARYNADKTVDTEFGVDGVIVNNVIEACENIYSQPDGKFLTVWRDVYDSFLYLTRYNQNGDMDSSFQNYGDKLANGLKLLSYVITFLPDGKIQITGTGGFELFHEGLVTLQFNADGTPDVAFHDNGVFTVELENFRADAVPPIIQPDGKTFMHGYQEDMEAVARLNIDGSIDNSFGVNGIAILDNLLPDAVHYRAHKLQMQPDGKIIIHVSNNDNIKAMIRLNANGTLDTRFGRGGIVVTETDGNGRLKNVIGTFIQENGKILQVSTEGSTVLTKDYYLQFFEIHYTPFFYMPIRNLSVVIRRFNSNGSVDNTFGNGGAQISGLASCSIDAENALLVSDDKLMVYATQDDCTTSKPLMVEYDVNGAGAKDIVVDQQGVLPIDGLYSTATNSQMIIQNDGKLLAAGHFSYKNNDVTLVRHNPDGSLDKSFGVQGVVSLPVLPENQQHVFVNSIALQADGKILATVNADRFTVLRFNVNGTLDKTFGINGISVVNVEHTHSYECDTAYNIAVQNDNKIIVTGAFCPSAVSPYFEAIKFDIGIARLLENGSLDSGFGENGIVNYSLPDATDAIGVAVSVQQDGNIVIGATTGNRGESMPWPLEFLSYPLQPLVLRYNSSGTLMDTFPLSSDVTCHTCRFLLAPDNSMFILQNTYSASDNSGLIKLNLADDIESDSARVVFNLSNLFRAEPYSDNMISNFALQADGKLVVVTSLVAGQMFGGSNIGIKRLNTDGTLDVSFGDNGFVITDLQSRLDKAGSVVIQPDGKIVVLGSSLRFDGNKYVLARYNTDGSLDKTFHH